MPDQPDPEQPMHPDRQHDVRPDTQHPGTGEATWAVTSVAGEEDPGAGAEELADTGPSHPKPDREKKS